MGSIYPHMTPWYPVRITNWTPSIMRRRLVCRSYSYAYQAQDSYLLLFVDIDTFLNQQVPGTK